MVRLYMDKGTSGRIKYFAVHFEFLLLLFVSAFPLARDANIPAILRQTKIINKICKLLMNAGWRSGVILTFPRKIEKISVEIPMLIVWPVIRIVPRNDEATPRYFLGTELITAFVLGDEKSAKPNPRMIRHITI